MANANPTSTNDESQATTDLEDMEVSFDDSEEVEDTTTETEVESDDAAATEETDDTEEESDADDSEESTDSEADADEATDTEQSAAPADEQARANAAKQAYAQREQERLAREGAKAEAQQEYLNNAEDNRDLALRQLQIDAYNNRVQTNSDRLSNGIDKAVASIDLFRTGSPEAKEELANSLDDFERMYVQKDENGDPVQVSGDVFQYLQAKAASIQRLTEIGARQQGDAKTKQKSKTMRTPSQTPKEPKVDADLAAFDEEASTW